MKTTNLVFLFVFFVLEFTPDLKAQSELEKKRGVEIGIDFLKFNRNWIYSHDHHTINGHYYAFDFIPSVYLKLLKDKFSIRFNYEFFHRNYVSRTNFIDGYEAIEGGFKENRIFAGIERNIVNKRVMIYFLNDIGLSLANYEGKYSSPSTTILEYFDINILTISLQPGIGAKLKLSKRISLNLESSMFIGMAFNKSDPHKLIPNPRFIPRPISLLGICYKFN